MGRVVDAEVARVSRRIRDWRDQAGLTLQELARRSGVATSTIQKVETEQMIPSLAVILKIARGLGRRSSELVHDGGDELEMIHLRAEERHSVGVKDRMLLERLSGDLPDPAVEVWRVILHPGVSSGEPIHWNGEELVLCEQGAVTFRVGEREFVLSAGDSLHFKASIPHSWRNHGRDPATFTVTGTLPRRFRAVMSGRLASGGGR